MLPSLCETINLAGLPYLCGVSEQKISSFARVAYDRSLQEISGLLCDTRCWSFAVAFDGATCNGQSFLDVRARLFVSGEIQTLHLLAIPLFVRLTREAMFEAVYKLLDSVSKMEGKAYCGDNGWSRKYDRSAFRGRVTSSRRIFSWILPHMVRSSPVRYGHTGLYHKTIPPKILFDVDRPVDSPDIRTSLD